MSETDRAAFLKAIQADPAGTSARLTFADWLDEHGDPQGEFIRVQCELFNIAAEYPIRQRELWRLMKMLGESNERWKALWGRERELLAAHEAEWLAPVKAIPTQEWKMFYFLQGFIGHGWVHLRDWQAKGEEILEAAPLMDSLDLRGFEDHADAVAALPTLGRIRHLTLDGYTGTGRGRSYVLGDEGVAALAQAPAAANFRSLRIRENAVGAEGARQIATSPHLAGLELLDLWKNDLGDRGLRLLAESSRLEGLRFIDLQQNGLTSDGVLALLRSPLIDQLEYVDLRDNSKLRPFRERSDLPPQIVL
jgi:uncharacterized protein (TIGR02996 family)